MPKTLIAGGAGFIGINLINRLLKSGHDITVLDNFLTSSPTWLNQLLEQFPDQLKFIEHDICNPIIPLFPSTTFDQIYHLASPASPSDYLEIPLQTSWTIAAGTKNLLDLAAKQGSRFFLASSSEVYGNPELHPQPETYFGPINPHGKRSSYRAAKQYAESLAFHYHSHYQFPLTIGRIFNAYGPFQRLNDGRVIPSFIRSSLSEEPISIYGDGSQTRSFVYIEDLLDQIETIMSQPLFFEVINLGADYPRKPNNQNLLNLNHLRHNVKPGLTGLWQLSPARVKLIHEHPEYDLSYIASISLKLDLRILLWTLLDFTRGTGI